jgi:hypothetical protein
MASKGPDLSRISETHAAGATDDGLLQLRHAIAQGVMARMKGEIPGLSPHFGEDYEKSDEPEPVVYRSSGASFQWVAFAFSPWRMWDLHVGVVPTEGRRLSIGFHISERASAALLDDLKRVAGEIGASVRHQQAAIEYQANLPLFDVDAVPLETLVDAVAQLCRKYAAVAAKVPCPAGMRDAA